MENIEYRMYGLVPGNISDIQKSIQFGHAEVEYAQKYFNDAEYQHWAEKHKTFIILNGGTSNHTLNRYEKDVLYVGTMEQHLKTLQDAGVKVAAFYEPDLNDMLSAIVFLVPEKVFNKKDYPEPEYLSEDKNDTLYQHYLDSELKELIGEENFFLRKFLSQFRLA